MTKQIMKRGFTLIELLVVIAIIGILASVVLASLNSARDKGEDAAIKSSLNNIRAQAEIVYDDLDRSYDDGTDGVCNNETVSRAVTEAGSYNSATCADTDSAWAAEALLNSGDWYCVDSTGNATDVGTSTITADSDLVCD